VLSGRLPDPEATIVALASAAGPGARAILRLSGKSSAKIIQSLLPEFERDLLRKRHWQAGEIRLSGLYSPLAAEVYFWAGPSSYTGQDVAEIHTISSPPLVQLLLKECLAAGARAAEPGEFTMRAFLAGKIDLPRAEAILGVIEATSRDRLREALMQLAGGLAQPLHELREDLLDLLADVEAGLDFADEAVAFIDPTTLLHRITKGLAFVTLAQKQIQQRALGHRPFRCVLAGPTNAGKSRLFNALVGASKAIVSEVAGTTRDWLEAIISIDGVRIQVVDTAGRRGTEDLIEKRAQGLGEEQAHEADLILWCRAPDDPFEPKQMAQPMAAIATKSDLGTPWRELPAVSAVTGAGLVELRKELVRRAGERQGDALLSSLSRCRHHVDACLGHLRRAHRLVLEEEPAELLALELRSALEELGAIVGAVYTDDLLDRIFSRFCIGK
jgi:tRNA modification GTPase